MTAIYDFLLHVNNTVPPWVVAALLGWLVSITITQAIKFAMLLHWDALLREGVARLVAFGSAAFTVIWLMPTFEGLILALAVGVWSPLAFWLLMKSLDGRFPGARDFLSGDVRGFMGKGETRENRP